MTLAEIIEHQLAQGDYVISTDKEIPTGAMLVIDSLGRTTKYVPRPLVYEYAETFGVRRD